MNRIQVQSNRANYNVFYTTNKSQRCQRIADLNWSAAVGVLKCEFSYTTFPLIPGKTNQFQREKKLTTSRKYIDFRLAQK